VPQSRSPLQNFKTPWSYSGHRLIALSGGIVRTHRASTSGGNYRVDPKVYPIELSSFEPMSEKFTELFAQYSNPLLDTVGAEKRPLTYSTG
jgi:hypothetical protein